jgi:hypothetical protein
LQTRYAFAANASGFRRRLQRSATIHNGDEAKAQQIRKAFPPNAIEFRGGLFLHCC